MGSFCAILISFLTLTHRAESEDNPIRVIGVIVVAVAIVIHVTEIVSAISRPQPPVVRGVNPISP